MGEKDFWDSVLYGAVSLGSNPESSTPHTLALWILADLAVKNPVDLKWKKASTCAQNILRVGNQT
jgi:hypothetical protein